MADTTTDSWPLGATVCFGGLEFIIAIDGTLVRIESPVLTPPRARTTIEAPWALLETVLPIAAYKGEQL